MSKESLGTCPFKNGADCDDTCYLYNQENMGCVFDNIEQRLSDIVGSLDEIIDLYKKR